MSSVTSADGVTLDEPRGRWILATAILGSSVVMLDGTVVNIALPAIGTDLGADLSGLQWIVNGYLLALASLILLGGSLGDRFGRRRIFVVGTVWFALASLLCGLAPNVGVLVAARVLQGVGGALLTPASLAILQSSFAPGHRARAIGAWSGLGGIATAVGPFLGGWLIDAVSWRAVFLINLPLAIVTVAIAVRHVPESAAPDAGGPIDVAGAVLGALGLAGVTYALIEAPAAGASGPVVTAAVAGIAAAAGFVVVEARGRTPMLPLSVFANRQFSGANAVTFAVYAALSGVFFLLVVQLQQALGYTPLQAGVATLPVTGLMLLLSSRAGALAERIGPRRPMTFGPLVIAAGLVLMARITPGASYVWAVLPAVVVFGLGLSLTVAPLTATVLAAVDAGHAGIASGVNNAVARAAGLLAVAALPAAAGLTGDVYQDPQAFSDGFVVAVGIAAALCAIGGVLAWLTIRDEAGVDAGVAGDLSCCLESPQLREATPTEAAAVE